MLAILSEYTEYPAQYRQIIWRTLLKCPNNTNAYTELIKKGEHGAVTRLFTNHSKSNREFARKCSRIASYLMHWSQILDISRNELSNFLPDFILPFVKQFASNMLVCFEVIATILFNHCQLWFEYSPLPPINYLGCIENLLDFVDPTLTKFFKKYQVTNLTYAWQLVHSSFSEQLDEWQWLQLWDHIVSQPPYYLVFIVVAFSAVQRRAILNSANFQEINVFYQEPSSINMKMWFQKANEIMTKCPASLHPRQYMREFMPLSSSDHQYQKILNYPQQLFAKQTERCSKLTTETTAINRKYMELERFEMDLMQQLVDNIRVDEHKRRMQNIELEHERAILDRVKHIEMQRQHLVMYERQLNDRVALMTMLFVENELENECNEREHHLKKTLNYFEQQVCQLVFTSMAYLRLLY